MSEKKRQQNESKFDNWKSTEDGGRIYWFEVTGNKGWKAKYLKEVDENEKTRKFWQEIYNEKNVLVEVHEKYPTEKGHKKIKR